MLDRRRLGSALDVLVLGAGLTVGLWLPVAFLVPYNDEWLRIDYLAAHSVWDWIVEHARTWVVRPTAELILGLVALPNVRTPDAPPPTARAFLAHYHGVYMWLIAALGCMLWANAAALAGRLRAVRELALVLGVFAVCALLSDELGYALFWTDGYANIVLPFLCMTLGMLLCAGGPAASAGAVLCLVVGALGHEVTCIFSLGFLLTSLALRRPRRSRLAAQLTALALCAWILYVQLFSAGPELRSQAYFARTGLRYNVQGMWQALALIDVPRSLLVYALCLSLAALAADVAARARADFRQRRAFYAVLALGALLTALLPLASVGLKKPPAKFMDTGGGYYLLHTELFVGLSALLSYPWIALASPLERLARPYRRWIGSSLPLIAAAALASPDLSAYRTALGERTQLRAAARAYMTSLASAPAGQSVRVCRPEHPFVKPRSTMTTRFAAKYFGLRKVTEHKCSP